MTGNLVKRLKANTLAKNAGWIFAGQGLSLFFQAAYFVFLARLLGSSEYGVLVGVFATVSLLSQYSSLGSGFVFLRYVGPDHTRFSVFWGRILIITFGLGVCFVLILHVTGRWLLVSTPPMLILLVAINECICSQIILCCSQVFQTFEKMKLTAILGMSANVLRALLAMVFFFTLGHVKASVWASVSLGVSVLTTFAAIMSVARLCGKPVFHWQTILSFHGEGLIFSVSGSTTSVYNDIDKSMLGHYGLNTANAIYSMAYRVIDIATMPVRSLHSAAFPQFFRLGSDGGVTATSHFAGGLLKKTAATCLVVAIVLYYTSPLSPFLFGKGFAASVQSIRWLCLIPFLRCFHLSAGDALTGAGYQKYRLATQASAALGNFGMNLYLIPHYSWRGAAVASLITDFSLGLMNWTVLLIIRKRKKLHT